MAWLQVAVQAYNLRGGFVLADPCRSRVLNRGVYPSAALTVMRGNMRRPH